MEPPVLVKNGGESEVGSKRKREESEAVEGPGTPVGGVTHDLVLVKRGRGRPKGKACPPKVISSTLKHRGRPAGTLLSPDPAHAHSASFPIALVMNEWVEFGHNTDSDKERLDLACRRTFGSGPVWDHMPHQLELTNLKDPHEVAVRIDENGRLLVRPVTPRSFKSQMEDLMSKFEAKFSAWKAHSLKQDIWVWHQVGILYLLDPHTTVQFMSYLLEREGFQCTTQVLCYTDVLPDIYGLQFNKNDKERLAEELQRCPLHKKKALVNFHILALRSVVFFMITGKPK